MIYIRIVKNGLLVKKDKYTNKEYTRMNSIQNTIGNLYNEERKNKLIPDGETIQWKNI